MMHQIPNINNIGQCNAELLIISLIFFAQPALGVGGRNCTKFEEDIGQSSALHEFVLISHMLFRFEIGDSETTVVEN